MKCFNCQHIWPRHEHAPVFAIWEYAQTRFSCLLCKNCLDHWLDSADDDPELEPSRLTFINT